MEKHSGAVDTADSWLAEMSTWDIYSQDGDALTCDAEQAERQRQYDSLVEVKKVEGHWVEV
jgi:hypothetical protein